MLQTVDALLQLDSVVDVNMSGKMGIALFINLNDCVKQLLDTFSYTTDRRNHRHTQKISQLSDVQLVTPCLQLIIHIQSHHNPKVHIDELSSEIKITLKIGCIHNIYDHIRHVLHKTLSHVNLFRTICRKGICARQVNQLKAISSILKTAFLRINCHSTVIAHMLVASGGHIEK